MNNSNNKETINLLDLLSNSDTDVSDLVLTPKKKKVKRRYRRGNAVKMKQSDSCCCGKSDMRVISLWLAAVLITFWLIALSWLAVILYGEIKKMDISIKSGGYPWTFNVRISIFALSNTIINLDRHSYFRM